jgi:hypothetical protein
VRSLADHHRDVVAIAQAAVRAARCGESRLELRMPFSTESLVIEWSALGCVPEADGPMLVLYWSAYWRVDRLLRLHHPFDIEAP